jgi:hypothetical protein
MPYATNAHDGTRVYFENDRGDSVAVVLHGGLLDSVADLREAPLRIRGLVDRAGGPLRRPGPV